MTRNKVNFSIIILCLIGAIGICILPLYALNSWLSSPVITFKTHSNEDAQGNRWSIARLDYRLQGQRQKTIFLVCKNCNEDIIIEVKSNSVVFGGKPITFFNTPEGIFKYLDQKQVSAWPLDTKRVEQVLQKIDDQSSRKPYGDVEHMKAFFDSL